MKSDSVEWNGIEGEIQRLWSQPWVKTEKRRLVVSVAKWLTPRKTVVLALLCRVGTTDCSGYKNKCLRLLCLQLGGALGYVLGSNLVILVTSA